MDCIEFHGLKVSDTTEWLALSLSQVALVVKNLPANIGDIRDEGSIPGQGIPTGGGHGNPFQYSYLENLMDRGAWQATAQEVGKSQTQQSN